MRFSIRDLLWATLVVAMGLGWWVDHQRWSMDHQRLERLAIDLKLEAALARLLADTENAQPSGHKSGLP